MTGMQEVKMMQPMMSLPCLALDNQQRQTLMPIAV
jgi:hypothetical protein